MHSSIQIKEILMINVKSATCVFYDGACPLCSREVKLYKKLAFKEGNESEIEWVDISSSQKELKVEGIEYADAMQLMHIKDGSGVHQVGIDAVLTIWDQLPYYRTLSKLLRSIPAFYPLLKRVYKFVATHRMKITGRVE
jgi:predicted DCC family thiol-disulfide oxidoreductase YuxK